jgi:hypothetical protein
MNHRFMMFFAPINILAKTTFNSAPRPQNLAYLGRECFLSIVAEKSDLVAERS